MTRIITSRELITIEKPVFQEKRTFFEILCQITVKLKNDDDIIVSLIMYTFEKYMYVINKTNKM